MKFYISGPITGTEGYMERFASAEKKLNEKGYIVVNPAKVNAMLPAETTHEEYMRVSMVLLEMCDAVYFLKGWERSAGAFEEYEAAKKKGKKMRFE